MSGWRLSNQAAYKKVYRDNIWAGVLGQSRTGIKGQVPKTRRRPGGPGVKITVWVSTWCYRYARERNKLDRFMRIYYLRENKPGWFLFLIETKLISLICTRLWNHKLHRFSIKISEIYQAGYSYKILISYKQGICSREKQNHLKVLGWLYLWLRIYLGIQGRKTGNNMSRNVFIQPDDSFLFKQYIRRLIFFKESPYV